MMGYGYGGGIGMGFGAMMSGLWFFGPFIAAALLVDLILLAIVLWQYISKK